MIVVMQTTSNEILNGIHALYSTTGGPWNN
jgi:hypothetical protein